MIPKFDIQHRTQAASQCRPLFPIVSRKSLLLPSCRHWGSEWESFHLLISPRRHHPIALTLASWDLGPVKVLGAEYNCAAFCYLVGYALILDTHIEWSYDMWCTVRSMILWSFWHSNLLCIAVVCSFLLSTRRQTQESSTSQLETPHSTPVS